MRRVGENKEKVQRSKREGKGVREGGKLGKGAFPFPPHSKGEIGAARARDVECLPLKGITKSLLVTGHGASCNIHWRRYDAVS